LPKTSSWRWLAEAAVVAAILAPAVVRAQDTLATPPYSHAVSTWIALIASPGYERLATDRILSATNDWTRDDMGNLVKHTGSGSPKRVVACGIDETGYVVSDITDDGYLRVHGTGNGKHPPLWDQYHEGQRVIVVAVNRNNPLQSHNVTGVFAVRSNHLWRRRTADDSPTSIENLYLDVGARSRAEVEKMGIDKLDPVVRDWPEWTYSDFVSGPAASNRAGCAAVVAAAGKEPTSGETVFIVSAQKSFAWAGLTSALLRVGHVDSLFIVDGELGRLQSTPRAVKAPWPALSGLDVGATLSIGIVARFTGTLAETLQETDIQTLFQSVAKASGVGNEAPKPIVVRHGWVAAPPVIIQDSLTRYAEVVGKLSDIYAPSGFEQPMRDAIQAMLPAWARSLTKVDTAGNLVLAMGPDRDTTVVVAHMDEISFVVTSIARDGTVSLRPRGSFFPFMWEGQPALLHRPTDHQAPRDGKLGCEASRAGPMRGVFVPRDSSPMREPPELSAWFARDSVELVNSGVHVGLALTGYKCSARIGDMRITARSIDDRAGVTSLLLALDEIDPAKLDHKVIFVWSVREEGGLEGAKAAAAIFGPSVHRVHAVDTFVSSDSPLESQRFADAPIGQGATIRALDNTSATPPDEIDRVVRIARAASIPLQVGVTNGGNDGSEFARRGAVDVALAYPLRYSHSPAEVMDLRDLRSLTRIVAALAKAPTGKTVNR
jgi:putative aminopeptidase FrvX